MNEREAIRQATDLALAFWRSCKRPDLDEEAKVRGALVRYQMSLDAFAFMTSGIVPLSDDEADLGPRPVAFAVGQLRVEYRGTGLWAVVDGAQNLNREGHWEIEPLPSNRDEAFFERCRFPLGTALQLAQAIQEEPP